MGKSHEDFDQWEQAQHFYKLAEVSLSALPDDGYGKMVRDAVQRGLNRLADKTL